MLPALRRAAAAALLLPLPAALGLGEDGPSAAPPAAPAPVDASRPLEGDEPAFAGAAERDRREILRLALPKVQDLIQAVLGGSTRLTTDRYGRPRKLRRDDDNDALLAVMRAAYAHLNVRPNGDDWLNDPKDRETLDTLETAARLLAENLEKTLPKRKSPEAAPSAEDPVAKNWGDRILLYPDFWIADEPPYPSERCPGIILMHEYFHHLEVRPDEPVPSKRQRVYHGEMGPGPERYSPYTTDYALANAYSLTSFAVEAGLGRLIECVPGWEPGR